MCKIIGNIRSNAKEEFVKTLVCSIICVLSISIAASAQAPETFDVATFKSPKGWQKQAGANSVQFSTSSNADYCLITLFKSIPGLGDSKENFDAAWGTIVKETVTVSSAPEMAATSTENGWEIQTGYSPFEKDGAKGSAMLVTASGFGKMVNALILTNAPSYEPAISAFLGSIKLKKLAVVVKPRLEDASDVSAIVGSWGMDSSDQRSPAVGGGGYIKRQYDFNGDGTYVFMIKTFSYVSTELLFTKETGTYRLNGNSLTVTPKKGSIQAWTKGTVIEAGGRKAQTDNWGNLVKTQPSNLETVTYQISKEYFSGIDEWQLVMRTATPTQREGPFVNNSAFPNSYFYKTQKYPIEPPR